MIEIGPFGLTILLVVILLLGVVARRAAGIGGIAAVCILLLVLAAVGVRVPLGEDGDAVLLVDVSWSTGVGRPDLGELGRRAGLDPARTRAVLFGRRWADVSGGESRWPVADESDVLRAGRDASRLAGALRGIAPSLEAGGEVVVFTDGRVDRRGLAGAVERVRGAGARVRVRPEGRALTGDARVDALRLPSRVRAGSGAVARVEIAGPPGAAVGFALLVDGREVVGRETPLPPTGRAALALPVPPLAAGWHEVEAVLTPPPGDPCRENDRIAGGLVAAGARRAILVNAEGLSAALESAGYVTDAAAPGELPDLAACDLLVLRNVPITELPGQGESVRRYVESGGGLLVIGGPRAFGPGGYAGRPLEAALPVRSAPDDEGLLVVVLLDRSGTMAEDDARKLKAARSASLALVRVLPPGASFLFVPFADRVYGDREVVRIESEADRARAAAAVRAVDRGEGGTSLVAPLDVALEAVRRSDAARELVLVFSDGLAKRDDPADILARGARLSAAGVRVGVAAVGEDADLGLLDALAGEGRAAVRVSGDADVVAAFLDELLAVEGEDRIVTGPREVFAGPGADPPWPGAVPPVEAFVRTWPREGARVWHVDEDASPLTAGMRYGLGRSAVVTTDPFGPWAPGWADLGLLPALAARATRPALRTGPRIEAAFDGPRLRLSVHRAVEAPSLASSLTLADGARRAVRLEAAGPSRYEAEIPDAPAGPARIRIGAGDGVLDGGFAVPWPPEFAASGPDPAAVDALRATLGSGEAPAAATVQVRAVPAFLALLLLLLDRLLLARRGRLGLKRARPRSR